MHVRICEEGGNILIYSAARCVGASPVAARAQPAIPVIGFVYGGSADDSAGYVATFRKGLGETGYVVERPLT